MKLADRLEPQARAITEFLESRWFDRSRRVQTSGEVSLRAAGVDEAVFRDSEAYQPARPAHIRRALKELDIDDISNYSYVDLGSGKGRSLFVAAEQPFRSITGVELSPNLHAIASANVDRFRYRERGCCNIELRNLDAAQFDFPDDPIVLYMFNPFGIGTVRQVLRNLETSLRQMPRHAVIVLLWPQWEGEVAAMEGMKLSRATKEYRIYRLDSAYI